MVVKCQTDTTAAPAETPAPKAADAGAGGASGGDCAQGADGGSKAGGASKGAPFTKMASDAATMCQDFMGGMATFWGWMKNALSSEIFSNRYRKLRENEINTWF